LLGPQQADPLDNTEFIAESGTDGLHDSPLEEAVSSEPVSENRKFPASWENTGKFIDLGL